jgi:hypothetical protein
VNPNQRFMCGCKLYPSGDTTDVKFWKQAFTYDAEGFVICSVHRERRHGWRSIPRFSHHLDFMSLLQLERWLLFGEAAKMKTKPIRVNGEDIRDNRDPEMIGNEILTGSSGKDDYGPWADRYKRYEV